MVLLLKTHNEINSTRERGCIPSGSPPLATTNQPMTDQYTTTTVEKNHPLVSDMWHNAKFND